MNLNKTSFTVDFLRLETHKLKTTNQKLARCEDCRQQEYAAKITTLERLGN